MVSTEKKEEKKKRTKEKKDRKKGRGHFNVEDPEAREGFCRKVALSHNLQPWASESVAAERRASAKALK